LGSQGDDAQPHESVVVFTSVRVAAEAADIAAGIAAYIIGESGS
jgi:hypothetical protein